MAPDALFGCIERMHGGRPWGRLLDAGTGSHSLEWITGLSTSSWCAVTGDDTVRAKLERKFGGRMRAGDRILAGNWTDPALLHGERYTTVIADYLLGAIEGFAPFFQDRLFERLRPLAEDRLYYVGLAPYDDPTEHPWGQVVVEIARLRDACILLAGHRVYREHPLEWVLRQLEAAGFRVEDVETFPIRYGEKFVREQLGVARRKLPLFRDRKLARAMEGAIAGLEDRALSLRAAVGDAAFGADHVIAARAAGS